MVESGYSFKSAENIPQLLSLMDKESKIFPKMIFGRQKCGYYVTHALYPFCFEALIKQILEVPAYTLGVDGGLKKMIDIVIRWFNFSRYCLYHFFRYWEESRGEGGEVVDEFPDLHEVGHE